VGQKSSLKIYVIVTAFLVLWYWQYADCIKLWLSKNAQSCLCATLSRR